MRNEISGSCTGFRIVIPLCLALLCVGSAQQSPAQSDSRTRQPQSQKVTTDTKRPEQSSSGQNGKPDAGVSGVTQFEAPDKASTETLRESAEQRERFLRSAVEDILIGADRVHLVEQSILVQVEAAAVLWDIDRERANSVLRAAFVTFRGLPDKKDGAKSSDPSAAERDRLRASIFRRVARLSPTLVKELIMAKADADKTRSAIVTDWTAEARAVLTIADEEIDRNPALAARLAQVSLSLGTVDLPSFLSRLARRDAKLAEQQALILLSQLRDSAISPLYLLGFSSFVFSDGSPQLREYYYESVAIRIRRAIGPNMETADAEDLLNAARAAGQTANGYARWEAEFAQIISDLESLLISRSKPVPFYPRPMSVEMPKVAAEGDTRDIAEAAERVENIRDSKVRDNEYRKLAISAAEKADVRLAEKLVSNIENEDSRRKASVNIYGPLVRRTLGESDWAASKMYALKVSDPLGRSLIIDWIGQKMIGAKQTKQVVKELYDAALAQLKHDSATQDVGVSFLTLAKSIYPIDAEAGLDAMRWAVYVLNKASDARSLSGRPMLTGELGTWVRRQGYTLPEETLDLSELVGSAFSYMGKRDMNEALALAADISDRGVSLMARLAVVKAALEEVRSQKKTVKQGRQTALKD